MGRQYRDPWKKAKSKAEVRKQKTEGSNASFSFDLSLLTSDFWLLIMPSSSVSWTAQTA
jgi:hypothetical protein